MPDKKSDTQRGTHAPKKDAPQTRDLNAASRVALALKLRATRMTYEQIAQQCGYANASSCRKAILRELDRVVVRNVEHLRMEEAHSLDMLEIECNKRLRDSKYEKSMLFAVDRILAIKERRAKLMGLDVKDADAIGTQVIIEEVPMHYLTGPVFTEVQPS